MNKKLLCLPISLFLCGALFSLTVDEAVDYALKNSKTLQSAAIDLEIKTRAKDTAWNSLVPSVQVTGTLARSNKAQNSSAAATQMLNQIRAMLSLPPLPVDTSVSEADHWKAVGNIGVSFMFNAALVQEIRAARADFEAGLITWEQTRADTERSIRKLFYGLLLQQESVALQQKMLSNAQIRSAQNETGYKNGLVSELAFLQARVAYENQKPAVLKAEQEFKSQLGMFAFLLGLPLNSDIKLEGSIEPVFVDFDAEKLIADYVSRRADALLLQKNIELMRIRLSAMNLQIFTPSLSLSYGFQPVVSDITKNWFDDKNYADGGSFSASLAWNLTNMLPFSSTRQQAKTLQANLQKTEIQYATLLQKGEMEIRTLTDKLTQSRTVIEAGKSGSDLAQRSYDMTREAYRNGTAELLSLRDAEAQLIQARLSLASEKYNYLSNLLDLEYALQTKLTRTGE